MKYNDREQWIMSEGTWYGLASTFFGLAVVMYLRIPIESNTWVWGAIFGIIFGAFGMYSGKKAKSTK